MRVGRLEIDPPVLLAPMAAVTDLPFRTVAEELGVGFTITEFLSAHALAIGDPKTTGKMTASLGGRRFGVQIFGREAEKMAEAARLAVAIGASLVDINMGCPAKRVVAGECGSALMREPAIAQQLVRAVVAAVPAHVPVTVKHRAGWNQDHRNAPEFACAMVEAGAQMITVHGRTRTQGFAGKSDPDVIAAVRAAVPRAIPVVGNGDVVDVDGYMRLREHTGCDAVMIGRTAASNPWIFRQIRQFAETGRYDQPTEADRYQMIRTYFKMLVDEQMHGSAGKMKQFVSWFTHGVANGGALRKAVYSAQDGPDILASVEQFFEPELVNV